MRQLEFNPVIQRNTNGEGVIVRNRKCIRLAVAAALETAAIMTGSAALAEDFCDTTKIMEMSTDEEIEKNVRAKCKVGDIIYAAYNTRVGRLCDLHQPVVTLQASAMCFLAPQRKTY